MADSDKNILITPATGTTSEPTIQYTGYDAVSITQRILDNGTVSFEGSVGQLFSITNSLTGTIFSVNDISGIPSIEVLDTGEIRLAQYSGNVGVGKSSPASKLDVNGTVTATAFSGPLTGDLTGNVYGTLYGASSGAADSTIWAISPTYSNYGIFYDEGSPDRMLWKWSGTTKLTLNMETGGLTVADNTDSTSTITGSIITSGGMGIAKKLYVGTNLFMGTSGTPKGVIDLGLGTAGRGIAWGGGGGANYTNIWSSYSGAALVLARGLRGTTATSDGYVSSHGAAAMARSAIRLDGSNGIQLFTDASSTVAEDTAITPTLRMSIDNGGTVSMTGTLAVTSTISASGLAGSLLSSATPTSIAYDASVGVSTIPSRQDHTHPISNFIKSADTRNTDSAPNALSAGVYADFKANATTSLNDGGTYHALISFRAYSSGNDMSGGYPLQLGFTANNRLWIRTGTSTTTWGSWRTFVDTDSTQTVAGVKTFSTGIFVSGALSTSTSRMTLTNTEGGRLIIQSGVTGTSNQGAEFRLANVDGTSPFTFLTVSSTGAITLTGDVTIAKSAPGLRIVSSDSSNSQIWIDSPSGNAGSIRFRNSSGVQRWVVGKSANTESGTNTGSNFEVVALDDSGSTLFTPLTITRSTGNATFSGSVSVSALTATGVNGITVNGGLTYLQPQTNASNALWVRGKASQASSLVLFQNDSAATLSSIGPDGSFNGPAALSGTPTATTAAVDTNTTQIATTAYVIGQGYLKSATASSTYAPLASPTFTGTVVLPSTTSIGAVSDTEIGYLDGVTSAIQTQINSKLNLSGGTLTGTLVTVTPTTSLASINLPHGVAPSAPTNGDVWTTTAGMYVRINGVTVGPLASSAGSGTAWGSITGTLSDQTDLQNALNLKAPLASPAFTGTPTVETSITVNGVRVWRGAGAISGNTSVGEQTLDANTTGTKNTAVGYRALSGITTGSQSTAFGWQALYLATGTSNSAFGSGSLDALTTGYDNCAFGYNALTTATITTYSTAVGSASLQSNTGSGNTAVGYHTNSSSSSGSHNTAIGRESLYSITGSYNTGVGAYSLRNATGSRLVAIGYYAGYYETGSNAFYVDAYDRTNEANGKTKSLLYGQFHSTTPASQQLTINGVLNASYGINVSGTATTQGIKKAIVTKTAAYTLTATDHIVVGTSGTWNATLPTAASVAGTEYIIKNSGTGTITVDTTSSQTIDGSLTFPLGQYESITVVSDGSNWVII